ncbi:MAG: tRNA ((37)-N6)-threonylcarbamoyltransferase complex ATPase subunit type 1 TsaE [Burkholderiales bacterium]|jgi:tRNA threonylcarbamoyladenosine biosynthesis protein TsaE|nr:tRNA ((37)-N6)-threonylcarbamoyltransferase complex ATPase subunit type 1 TsaE [Burkholderiales bacterium]
MPYEFNLPDAAATLRLGEALAAGIGPGRVLHLKGELGAGKTTLVRGLLRALGHHARVKSPSYALLEPYTLSRLDLYHFDLYRFKDRSEWRSSGFREYFNPASACIVEWPERAAPDLAPPDLELTLEFAGEGRQARIEARTPAGASWLSSLRFFS